MLSGLAPETSIADMKSEVLSALKSDVSSDALDFMAMEPPQISVESDDDFELCRALKERGKPTGVFEILEPSLQLKDSGMSGWETIFLQFRDDNSGKHNLILAVRGITLFPDIKKIVTYDKFHVSGFSFLRLCEYHVEVVSLHEPHALNLQAIFYQSHTLFHQCMTKKHQQRRTKGKEQILPQTRNKIKHS